MHWSQFSVAALLAGTAVAQKHRIFTSSITSPDLYTLEFDETTNRLVTLSNLTGNAAHPSISFSYDKASLYAAQKGGFSSYTVEQGQSLVYSKTISVAGQPGCANAADKTAKYINSLARVPFTVFGSLDGTCGVGIGVDYSGAFTNIDQSFQYSPSSLVGGMTFDPENRYLYSADEAANGIWVHSVSDMGRLTQLGFVTAPWQNAGPKRIAVHTDGRFLYVLFSKLNRIGVFAVNVGVAANQALITYTGVSYSTLPPNANNNNYAAESIYISAESNILFATSRYKAEESRSAQTPNGYLRAILLTNLAETDNPTEDRAVGSGFPIRPILQIETRSGGGVSNMASPAPWSNEHIAIADSLYGRVEIWKLEGLAGVSFAGPLAQGAASAPKGGWVNKAWRPSGSIQVAANAREPKETVPKGKNSNGPAPPRPDRAQFGNPEAAASSKAASGKTQVPTIAPRPKATPQPKTQQPRPKTTTPAAPRATYGWPFGKTSRDDDDDDDDRRARARVEGVAVLAADPKVSIQKRQFPNLGNLFGGGNAAAAAPAAAVATPTYAKISARVLATWQAPTRSGCCSNALWFD